VARAHPEPLAAFDRRMEPGNVPGALAALGAEFTNDYAGIGDAEAVRAKVQEYRAAGATLLAVGPLRRHQGSAAVEAVLQAAAAD